MAEARGTQTWLYRALYVVLCMAILFAHLLPLDTLPRTWAPPEIMMCLTFAWVVRRPDYVPVMLIAAVFLLSDLLLLRPPGLWTALIVISSEYLRSRVLSLRDTPFPFEFGIVLLITLICFVVYRIGLSIVLVQQAQLSIFLTQVFFTCIAYSAVVAVSHFVLGVRKTSATDINTIGRRA